MQKEIAFSLTAQLKILKKKYFILKSRRAVMIIERIIEIVNTPKARLTVRPAKAPECQPERISFWRESSGLASGGGRAGATFYIQHNNITC